MSYIGAHASISGGMLKGIRYVVEELNGTAVQIFLGSSHSATLKSKSKISEDEIKEIKEYISTNDIFLNVHACYLLNFCKYPPSDSQIQYAIQNLIYDVNLAKDIGALGVVVHIGYQMTLERDEAYQNMANGIMTVIDKTPNGSLIILETPAGQGSQIATTIEDFAELYNMFPGKYKKRLGICVDTAHVFSAGANINTVAGVDEYFSKFEKLIGKQHLVLFHINDSKQPINSRKDQHQGLGYGYIYNKDLGGDIKALERLTQYAKKNKIPMVLETHDGASPSSKEKNFGCFADEIILLNKFAGNVSKNFQQNTEDINKNCEKPSKLNIISSKPKLKKKATK
jgi:deoxyribonuclease-4